MNSEESASEPTAGMRIPSHRGGVPLLYKRVCERGKLRKGTPRTSPNGPRFLGRHFPIRNPTVRTVPAVHGRIAEERRSIRGEKLTQTQDLLLESFPRRRRAFPFARKCFPAMGPCVDGALPKKISRDRRPRPLLRIWLFFLERLGSEHCSSGASKK